MEPTFIQWLIGQAGIGGLAGYAIFLLNEARKDATSLISQYALSNREDKILLIKALDENTKAAAILTTQMSTLLGLVTKLGERLNDQRVRTTKPASS